MARPEGFEPTTPGFEDRCSNPLSYERALVSSLYVFKLSSVNLRLTTLVALIPSPAAILTTIKAVKQCSIMCQLRIDYRIIYKSVLVLCHKHERPLEKSCF